MQHLAYQGHLYSDMPEAGMPGGHAGGLSIAAKLGLRMPNLAPDVEEHHPEMEFNPAPPVFPLEEPSANPLEPKKKKYAKEAWPGKKPTHSLLV